MFTRRETVKQLCQSILTRLENRKAIAFEVKIRQKIQDEVYAFISPLVLTEEDLREKTLDRIGASSAALAEAEFSDSDQYKSAKAVVKATFGDDVLNGLFYQKPLRILAQLIRDYLMKSKLIDEVYETDADLDKMIVESIQKFNPEQLH